MDKKSVGISIGSKGLAKSHPKNVSLNDIVFDLRNEVHANRMKFGIWGTKSFQFNFDLF